MNIIGQKASQLIQSSHRALLSAQQSGSIASNGMAQKAGQLSNRFIQTGGQQAIKNTTPIFNFLESQELAPVKQMHCGLRDFSRQFDNEGLANKAISQFSSTCYNLQIAKGNDEIGLAKSMFQSSLTKCIKLLKPTINPDQSPSPEAIQAFNKLTALQDETMKFVIGYKRDV